jgi:uridine kinase
VTWAGEVVARIRATDACIVGISGVDTAGKSTLGAEVAARLPGAVLIEGDAFMPPPEARHREPNQALGYYRDGFDYRVLFDDILPALRTDGRLTIVEGCFLFAGDNAANFDLRVWIDLPLERVLARALVRDAAHMGGEDEVRRRYSARYLPGQRLHLERDDPAARADLVLQA